MSLEHAPGAKSLVCIGLKLVAHTLELLYPDTIIELPSICHMTKVKLFGLGNRVNQIPFRAIILEKLT